VLNPLNRIPQLVHCPVGSPTQHRDALQVPPPGLDQTSQSDHPNRAVPFSPKAASANAAAIAGPQPTSVGRHNFPTPTTRPCWAPQPSIDFERKVRVATHLLQDFSARSNAYGAFSGGKDSCVIRHLAAAAGITDLPWVYSVTTIDPPELMRFVHDHHPDVRWRHPKKRFFRLLETNGPPSAQRRWCCRLLKESFRPPAGGVLFTGVRAAESPRRARLCKQIMWHKEGHFPIVAPIFDWTDDDVWNYIDTRAVPYCKLYDTGKKRLGCVGCPMNSRRAYDVASYPYIARQWQRSLRTWYDTQDAAKDPGLRAKFPSFDQYARWYWSDKPWPYDVGVDVDAPCQLMLSGTTDEETPESTQKDTES